LIAVATCVYAVSGIAFNDALWNIPAALAYQLHFLYWQRQGHGFGRDNRRQILKELDA
jgi:hypothetical protein